MSEVNSGNVLQVPSATKASSQAVKGLTSAAKRLDGTAQALAKLSAAASKLNISAAQAQKAVRSLLSFDEINRLSQETSSSSSGKKSSSRSKASGSSSKKRSSGTGAVQLDLLNAAQTALEKLKTLLRGLWSTIQPLLQMKAPKAFEELSEAAGRLAERVSGALQWGWENVLKPMGQWTLNAALPAVVHVLAGAFDVLSGVLDVLAPIGLAIWENFLRPLASWTGGAIVTVLNAVGDALEWLADKLEVLAGWLNGDGGLLASIGDAIFGLGSAVSEGFWTALGNLKDGLTQWFTNNISKPLSELNPFVNVHLSLFQSASELWANFKQSWGNNREIQALVKLVKSGWSTIKSWLGNVPSLSAAVSLVKNGWSTIKSWLGSIPVVSAGVKLAKSGWSTVSKWIGSIPAVSVAVKLAKSGWSTVKSWLGTLSAKFNIQLPKVTVSWSGSPIALPKFSLKWNAEGGILNGATLFGRMGNTLLGGGEAGREAVLPLDRNTGWMDDLAARVAQSIKGSGDGAASPQNINISVMLDGRAVGRSVVRYVNGVAKATGSNPLSAYI